MNPIIITIARQYGSGGKTIGEMVADELGIPCYNREILRMASEESGINEKLFAKADERLKGSALFRISRSVYEGELLPPDSDDFTSTRNLFNYQAKIIKKLAETESCVVVGRCANFILRNYPNVMSVFVHAPHEFCMRQAMMRSSMTEREMEKFIARTDKYRGEYHKYYTGWDWEDARHYDLCLDSSKLGFEKCKEEILSYRKIRFGVD
jgi:cytidylate kinase